MSITHTIPDIAALQQLASHIGDAMLPMNDSHASLITLGGPLGAGKTAFTKALATVLGVTETIVSPTFVVMKQYYIAFGRFEKLFHIDAYRLEDETEVAPLHLDAILANPAHIVVVEWAEHIPLLQTLPRTHIDFLPSSEDESRTVTITEYGKTA
jgi:tRNA threonylcarbamoyladenosine biosynthesis protein TsaE